MNHLLPLFLIPLLIFASGCNESDTVEKAKERAQEHALKLAEKANDSWARIQAGDLSDLEGFRQQIRALKASLAAQDYSKARECAEQIDKLLRTKIVAQSIEFLRIESAHGAQQARAAVQEYMARNNLGEAETKAFREVLRYFEQLDKKQRMDLVAVIIYIACESKMSHTAAVPAAFSRILMEELFGDAPSPNASPIPSK